MIIFKKTREKALVKIKTIYLSDFFFKKFHMTYSLYAWEHLRPHLFLNKLFNFCIYHLCLEQVKAILSKLKRKCLFEVLLIE